MNTGDLIAGSVLLVIGAAILLFAARTTLRPVAVDDLPLRASPLEKADVPSGLGALLLGGGFAALLMDEATAVLEWTALTVGLLAIAAGFFLGSRGRSRRGVIAGRSTMLVGMVLLFFWLYLTISR